MVGLRRRSAGFRTKKYVRLCVRHRFTICFPFFGFWKKLSCLTPQKTAPVISRRRKNTYFSYLKIRQQLNFCSKIIKLTRLMATSVFYHREFFQVLTPIFEGVMMQTSDRGSKNQTMSLSWAKRVTRYDSNLKILKVWKLWSARFRGLAGVLKW